MIIDALLKVASAQAFGAAGVSASSIDTALVAPGSQTGTGEPVGFGIQITTGGTVAATDIEIISATDAALTAGILSHVKVTIPLAAALANALFWIPLPKGFPTQRFLGIRATTAGGTISLSAWFSASDMFSLPPLTFPKNYAV